MKVCNRIALRSTTLTIITMVAGAALPEGATGQDHYCGVYSAYTVLEHYGQPVSFEDVLEPQYVAGFGGSTAEGIVDALNDHAVPADSYSGLGVFDLRMASGPMILHVRGSQGRREYEHWVVYLGEQDGQAVLLDPSRGRTSVSYSRLLAMWDGVGVAASPSRFELRAWRALGVAQRWVVLLVLGCVICPLMRIVQRRIPEGWPRRGWVRAVAAPALLVAALSATAMALDLLSSTGVIRGAVARASIASVRSPGSIPDIELDEAMRLFDDRREGHDGVVWIDARYRRDYQYGHIPGALSLPIDAGFAEEDELVAGLAPEAEIVVYCQSRGCAFADAVAERLRGHGFEHIRVYAPGYSEWTTAGCETEPQPEAAEATEAAEVETTPAGAVEGSVG